MKVINYINAQFVGKKLGSIDGQVFNRIISNVQFADNRIWFTFEGGTTMGNVSFNSEIVIV